MFLEKLARDKFASDAADPQVERFELGKNSWQEIIDSARTLPLFSCSGRILLIESPARKKDRENIPTAYEELGAQEKILLQEYFSAPVPETVLVMIFPGKIRKSSSLVRFFLSLGSTSVRVDELRPLKGNKINEWVRNKLREAGKNASQDAVARIVELAGNDLRRLFNELEKIVTFAGDKNLIELDDINMITGWVKSFVQWELSDHLEKADYRQCMITLDNLLDKENINKVMIIALVAGFFKDILLAKLRLKEGGKDKKAIFKEIKPHIHEGMGSFYQLHFDRLFRLTGIFSFPDLKHILNKLAQIDLQIKSTQLSFQELMAGFFFEYCEMRKRDRAILRRRD